MRRPETIVVRNTLTHRAMIIRVVRLRRRATVFARLQRMTLRAVADAYGISYDQLTTDWSQEAHELNGMPSGRFIDPIRCDRIADPRPTFSSTSPQWSLATELA